MAGEKAPEKVTETKKEPTAAERRDAEVARMDDLRRQAAAARLGKALS